MIKHIVMFKLKEEYNSKEKQRLIEQAVEITRDFQNEIPSVINFELSINSALAPDSNYDIALLCDFENIDGLNEYQEHPKHKEFASFIGRIRELRACIDYEY